MMPWDRFLVVSCCFMCGLGSAVNIAITDPEGGHTISLNSKDDLETVLNQLKAFENISVRQVDDSDVVITESSEEEDEDIDSWSIVWYIASFGGLITFFLVVSCSEWCCRKHVREQQRRPNPTSPPSPTPSFDVPPPAYDLFAPPSYDSLNYARSSGEKSDYEVYVVPVHTYEGLTNVSGGEQPPSYSSVNVATRHTSSDR